MNILFLYEFFTKIPFSSSSRTQNVNHSDPVSARAEALIIFKCLESQAWFESVEKSDRSQVCRRWGEKTAEVSKKCACVFCLQG